MVSVSVLMLVLVLVGGGVLAAGAVAVADLVSRCRSLVLGVLCLAQELETVSSPVGVGGGRVRGK